jgi:tol-pal system protein YbgF
MKRLWIAPLLATFLLSQTGCLKTRAQLRGEDSDSVEQSQAQASSPQAEAAAAQAHVIDDLKTEITRLTGRIEELERAGAQKDSSQGTAQQEQIKRLEQRIVELEQAQMAALEALKKMQVSQPAADSVDLYERGRKSFESGDMPGAINALSGYLKNPKGKHVEDATWLRGEAYYAQKEWKKAIIDYSKFPEKFGKSKRVPAALLRIGQSFDALGMKDDAKGFYQELTEKFPNSPEAKKLRSRR